MLRQTSDHRDHRCVSRRSLSCRVRPFRPEWDCDRGNDRVRGAGVLQVQYTRSELSPVSFFHVYVRLSGTVLLQGAVQRPGRRRRLPCGRWNEPVLLCCAYRVRRRGRRYRSRPYQAAPVELMDPHATVLRHCLDAELRLQATAAVLFPSHLRLVEKDPHRQERHSGPVAGGKNVQPCSEREHLASSARW